MTDGVQEPSLVSLGSLIQQGRVATEGLWAHPDDSAGRRHVGELIAQVRSEATVLGQVAMLPVCDEVGPMANSAPTPQAVEILIGGFETLARLWRATQKH